MVLFVCVCCLLCLCECLSLGCVDALFVIYCVMMYSVLHLSVCDCVSD